MVDLEIVCALVVMTYIVELYAYELNLVDYQPKATTLMCVLVRMVTLVLILNYPSPNRYHTS